MLNTKGSAVQLFLPGVCCSSEQTHTQYKITAINNIRSAAMLPGFGMLVFGRAGDICPHAHNPKKPNLVQSRAAFPSISPPPNGIELLSLCQNAPIID